MAQNVKTFELWRQPGYCSTHPAPPNKLPSHTKWAIHFHLGRNWDILPSFTNLFKKFPVSSPPDIWITYHNDQSTEKIIDLPNVSWIPVPNVGADVLAFLIFCQKAPIRNYLAILKLQAKKSNEEWFLTMVNDLAPSPQWIEWYLDCFRIRNDLGMIAPSADNTDYINFTTEIDLLIRAGIIPKPIHKNDLPSLEEITKNYEKDESQIKYDFPPPPNQYRPNGILLDTDLAWHLHTNPLGFANCGHQTYLQLQFKPFITNMIQQVYMVSGTMFWIKPEICSQLIQRFPPNEILHEFDEAIIKDNFWNKMPHAWERFFAAYTSIQGYTIMDVKNKIQFHKLPYHLVKQNFFDYQKIKNIPLHQLHSLSIKSKEPSPPWFSNPPLITRGYPSGINLWHPFVQNPTSNKTLEEWIYLTRLHQGKPNKTTWKHYLITNLTNFQKWLQETQPTQQPITLWCLGEFIQDVITNWKFTDKFPRMNIEFIKPQPFTSLIYDFFDNVARTFPPKWNIQFIDFPNDFPTLIPLEKLLEMIDTMKVNMPYWGKSMFQLYIDQYIQYEYQLMQMMMQSKQKNKLCIEIISPYINIDPIILKQIQEIEDIIQLTATDYQLSNYPTTHKLSILGYQYNFITETDYVSHLNWLKASNESMIHFYPFHPIIEKLMNYETNRNKSWEKTIHPTWKTALRIFHQNQIEIYGSSKIHITPLSGYLWHAQIFIIHNQSSNLFLNHIGIQYTDIIQQMMTQIPNNLNYTIATYQLPANENFTIWVRIACFDNRLLSQIWLQVISRQLQGFLKLHKLI